ncbi:HPP family protein [Solihabitans fulvus]|uniref:HPP family protein n=1 Tax=Solihabitans fulvus TaxID=1892852 RepID=A0A5B2WJ75_9PSEU|nr:HPP family protein [Solihabitans fulvus]KAA2250968.1 HPP family protein [Solihabitans fulvus]
MAEATTGQAIDDAPASAAPWYRSKAPARLGSVKLTVATATSVAALTALVAGGLALGKPLLIPPLAASMALVAGAPALPLSQPRNVIGGQLLSALTGFVCLWLLGGSPWVAGLAGGLALGTMLVARCAHSPAAATAVIVVLTQPGAVSFLLLLLLATAISVLVGIVGARAGNNTYPVYWW